MLRLHSGSLERRGVVRPYRTLVVWRKAHELTLAVYRATTGYPPSERYGLTSQTRRSAASVPANIAEGCGKRTRGQLRVSLDLAAGSLSELDYWLLLGRDLGLLPQAGYYDLSRDLTETRRLLIGFATWARPPRYGD